MNVIKRNGELEAFCTDKIVAAVTKANNSTEEESRIKNPKEIVVIAEAVEYRIHDLEDVDIESIQDMVIEELMKRSYHKLAYNYITYKVERKIRRDVNTTDDAILKLIECNNEEVKEENSNKNPTVNSVQRDYMAGEVSKDITRRFLLPPDVIEAHDEGILHFHDADYYAQHMHNCCLVNLDDMLQGGTVISDTMIDTPKMFSTACNIGTQCIAQIASSQYGGQTVSISALIPFVQKSRDLFRGSIIKESENAGVSLTDEQIDVMTETRVMSDIKRGVKLIQYQVLTLMTTNGQTPFITINLDITEIDESMRDDAAIVIGEILRQRIKGVKNEKGVRVSPAFPKLIYVLDECNATEDAPYWYLTELAAKCSAKRLVPDYVSAKVMRELKGGVWPPMGCRSFLTKWRTGENVSNAKNFNGEDKYYGRFNQGVVTINLVDVACTAKAENPDDEAFDAFWRILDERLELCHKALRCRHERLLGTSSDVAPILWQHGALARLAPHEKIDKLLFNGYSTISLGYAGLYETCVCMTGKSHTDKDGKPFALEVMQYMNDKCAQWSEAENIDYSVYGTPLESTTYKFAKALKRRFGIIPEVTDHNYITNSYHVCVREEIDAFTKLKFEAEFQKLSPGGAISYVEIPNMENNIPAVLSIIKFIYNNIMYAELNTKSDYCMVCGYDKEIVIKQDPETERLFWECPNCGNRDERLMSVARRTCGYIGSQFWNQGRTQEIRDRVLHVGCDFKPECLRC